VLFVRFLAAQHPVVLASRSFTIPLGYSANFSRLAGRAVAFAQDEKAVVGLDPVMAELHSMLTDTRGPDRPYPLDAGTVETLYETIVSSGMAEQGREYGISPSPAATPPGIPERRSKGPLLPENGSKGPLLSKSGSKGPLLPEKGRHGLGQVRGQVAHSVSPASR
jgi:hypothetical protein